MERQRKEEWERRRRGELKIKREQEQDDIIRLKAKKKSLEMELEEVVSNNIKFSLKQQRQGPRGEASDLNTCFERIGRDAFLHPEISSLASPFCLHGQQRTASISLVSF